MATSVINFQKLEKCMDFFLNQQLYMMTRKNRTKALNMLELVEEQKNKES